MILFEVEDWIERPKKGFVFDSLNDWYCDGPPRDIHYFSREEYFYLRDARHSPLLFRVDVQSVSFIEEEEIQGWSDRFKCVSSCGFSLDNTIIMKEYNEDKIELSIKNILKEIEEKGVDDDVFLNHLIYRFDWMETWFYYRPLKMRKAFCLKKDSLFVKEIITPNKGSNPIDWEVFNDRITVVLGTTHSKQEFIFFLQLYSLEFLNEFLDNDPLYIKRGFVLKYFDEGAIEHFVKRTDDVANGREGYMALLYVSSWFEYEGEYELYKNLVMEFVEPFV